MAVGIRLKFAGGTQEQYQAMHDTVNASSPLGRADGLLVHSIALRSTTKRAWAARLSSRSVQPGYAIAHGGAPSASAAFRATRNPRVSRVREALRP
jgi:hypothetical protein